MVHGLNYPRGILAWADEIGLDHVLAVLDALVDGAAARSATAPRRRCGGWAGPAGSGRQTGEGFFDLRRLRTSTMRAVTFQAPHEVRVDERPEPELEARDEAIVAIEASGICGSDLHIYHGRVKIEPGFTIGHEFVGTVLAAGDDVTRVAPGDRVLGLLSHAPAGRASSACAACTTSATGCACSATAPRSGRCQGTQAEQALVPMANLTLRKVPDGGLRRRRPVRRRRDGHRLPRGRRERRQARRQRRRAGAGTGRPVRGPGRDRRRRQPVLAIDTVPKPARRSPGRSAPRRCT